MRRALGIGVLVLAFAVQPLSAQFWEAGRPGDDIGSLAVNMAILSPSTTFDDDASTFDQGVGVGLTLSYWPFHHMGLRTHVLRGRTEGNHGTLAPCPPVPCSAVGYQDPVVWHYALEAAVRRPMGGDGLAWFPYLSGGIAGKSYRWSVTVPRIGYTGGGWTAAGGVDLRPRATGAFGLILEARTYQTRFRTLGKSQPYTDLVFTAGVALNR